MSEVPITIRLNGRERTTFAEPRVLLTDLIRHNFELTGTHIGCEQGNCGACTVRLDGVLVRSCLVFSAVANGRVVETIENLAAADGSLSAIQSAFADCHGLQCGFCTPGFLMSASDLLEETPDPTDDEIRQALGGNLCRCTGYASIVEAVRHAARQMRDQH